MRALLKSLIALAIFVTGCSVAPVATTTKSRAGNPPAPTPSGAEVRGVVFGGQQPIEAAQIYLLAVSTTGSGQQSTSLMKNVPGDTSNAGGVNGWYYVSTGNTQNTAGSFRIRAADYSCTTGQQVYLYSLGGNPQVAGTNDAAGLMAVLGTCTAPGTFSGLPATVEINEVTTVAATYALAGFAKDATDISGPGTAATAIANAAASAGNLVNLGTGLPWTTTPGGNGTVPSAEIVTLANILGACVNSQNAVASGPPPSGSACDTLFRNATDNGQTGGTEPADTAGAAINIARYPGNNIANLYGMATALGGGAAFGGGLTSQPNDFTVTLTYTGGGLNQPDGIAVDGNGNIWAADEGNNAISELDWVGNAKSGSGGLTGGLSTPKGLAIDANNNVWVASSGNNTVSEYNGTVFLSPSGGAVSAPAGVAIDGSGDVWAANGDNSLTEFVSGSGTNLTGGGLDAPLGIAADAFGNAWVADNTGARISEFNAAGAISPATGFTGGSLNGATGIAIDVSGQVWVTNQTGNSLSTFSKSGSALNNFTGGGLNGPSGIAIDGAGDVWIANSGAGTGNSISEYIPGAGFVSTTSGGYRAESADGTTNPLQGPLGIAVDGSGNVWVTNNASGANSITEFVGAATPVAATPLVNQPFNLSIATTSLPNGMEGTAYSATLVAGGGTKPYTWSQTGGSSLSTWNLTLNAATGVISGTPNATASAVPLSFTVKDSSNPQQQQSVTVNLTITAQTGMTVSVSPRNSGITTNQTLSLTPTTNDPNGVNWSASAGSGTTCSGSGCGTFSVGNTQTGVAVVYTPPPSPGAYVVTATSASETSVTASVKVGVTSLAGVYTYHNDNNRDGANLQEYALTTSNVAAGTFGKLFSCTVDSPIYTQPLWVANVAVNAAKHNVVFVATTNDSLYAFDADTSPCVQLWHANLLDATHGGNTGEVPVPAGTTNPPALVGQTPPSGDIEPTVGVIGTPVIDSSTNTLYVVSKSVLKGTTNTFYQRLHAIDITTGSEKFSGPQSITSAITYACTAPSCTAPTFDPQVQNQRCALALGNDGSNNVVYVAWGSHEDGGTYFGWVVGFNASTLAPEYVFNDAPDGTAGGIWMSGAAPSIDSSGNLYLLTGNGTFDANSASVPKDDYGDSMLELSPQLAVKQYFAPKYAPDDQLNGDDNDFGSGGALVLVNVPGGGGGKPTNLVIGGGKGGLTTGTAPNLVGNPGYFYVLNADQLGGYGETNAWQQVYLGSGEPIFSTGAFWPNATSTTSGTYFVGAQFLALQSYSLSTSTVTLVADSAGTNQFTFPGPTPSISSTPAFTNGIVWAQDNSNYCTLNGSSNQPCGPSVLYAYDATTLNALWNSGTSGANVAGHAMKFTVPTVANGKVYISTRGSGGATDKTTGELDVYGLLP